MCGKISKTVFVIMLITILFISCNSVKKETRKKNHKEYIDFLVSKNFDTIQGKHFEDFYQFKKEQDRQLLASHPYLKANKVYVNQNIPDNTITFNVFSDEGRLYMIETYQNGSHFLSEPENGKIVMKRSLQLRLYGFFEVEEKKIKINHYERMPSGEIYRCILANIDHDTIRYAEFYNTSRYGFKKNWLAKTHNTSFKLTYQPDMIATRSKNLVGADTFTISGSFNEERDLKEEKILEKMENVKY